MASYNCFNRNQRADEVQLMQNTGKIQTKKGGKKDKEYSIEWIQKTCTIRYKGEIKDRGILKWVPFINTLGETAVQIIAWSSVIIAFFGVYIIPEKLPDSWYIYLLAMALLFFLCYSGVFLFPYINYIKDTRCKKCHKNYAYEESENPDVREVSTENSYTVTITRYWKCKHCGYIDSNESSENMGIRKEKMKKSKKITCEKCGKSGISRVQNT